MMWTTVHLMVNMGQTFIRLNGKNDNIFNIGMNPSTGLNPNTSMNLNNKATMGDSTFIGDINLEEFISPTVEELEKEEEAEGNTGTKDHRYIDNITEELRIIFKKKATKIKMQIVGMATTYTSID